MKNILTAVAVLFGFGLYVQAEAVDAVLFNPSRLGRYEDLKVSSELSAPGGVLVQESSTVQSKSSVTVTSPAYELTNASAQQVSLPNTRFDTPVFTVGGGSASFTSGQVQELKDAAGKMIRVKGNTVNVTGNVHVNMTGGSEVNGGDVKGLKLGGNDIPRPGEGCEELGWYAYKTTSGKEYKVLGFKKCAGEEEEMVDKDCPEGKYYDESAGKCICEDLRGGLKKACLYGQTYNEETCECEEASCACTDAEKAAGKICDLSGKCVCPANTQMNFQTGKCEAVKIVTCFNNVKWTNHPHTPDSSGVCATDLGTWVPGHYYADADAGGTGYRALSGCKSGQECACTPGQLYILESWDCKNYGCKTNPTIKHSQLLGTCAELPSDRCAKWTSPSGNCYTNSGSWTVTPTVPIESVDKLP